MEFGDLFYYVVTFYDKNCHAGDFCQKEVTFKSKNLQFSDFSY